MGLTNPIVMDLAIPYYPTTKTVAIIMLVLLGMVYTIAINYYYSNNTYLIYILWKTLRIVSYTINRDNMQ